MRQAKKLRELIARAGLLMAPGAFDGITANLIQKAGFEALYVTGAGVSFSVLGQPDVNTVSYTELKTRVENILSIVDIPVIVDIDTGFGAPLNLIRLVKDFERMGVAAVQIEDQKNPKRCGHEMGRKVVSCEEMCLRIKAIADHRESNDGMLIIARTDSRTEFGIDEAIGRVNRYLEGGADILFVESPEKTEEIARIGKEVKGPLLFNNVEGGRSPFLSKKELEEMGFAIAIYPNSITRIMMRSGLELLKTLKEEGTTEPLKDRMMMHKEMWGLFGHDELVSLENRYSL